MRKGWGHAPLASVKGVALFATLFLALPALRFATVYLPQALGDLNLFNVVVGAVITILFGWAFKDSGDLKGLRGAFDQYQKDQERRAEERAVAAMQRLDRMDRDLTTLTERFAAHDVQANQNLATIRREITDARHALRNELAPKVTDAQVNAGLMYDKLDARLRASEVQLAIHDHQLANQGN